MGASGSIAAASSEALALAIEEASDAELRAALRKLPPAARVRVASLLAPPSAEPRYAKTKARVKGGRVEMALVDISENGGGDRPTIVFLHGSPTSSYMWRNVLPHCEGLGARLVAPDLIGMGDSDKLEDSGGNHRYSLAQQYSYLDALLSEVLRLHTNQKKVTLVGHSWGCLLGALWACRHPESVSGLAVMECRFTPFASDTMPPMMKGFVEAIRTDKGEAMVLRANMMIEQGIQGGTIRPLEQEMEHYRKPFLEPGEPRRPMLDFARAIAVDGEPEDAVKMMEEARLWLEKTRDLPKLLVCGDPGSSMTPDERGRVREWGNVTEEVVQGKHLLPEDSPDEIGEAIARWYRKEIAAAVVG